MTLPQTAEPSAALTPAQKHAAETRRLARLVLATFIFTFVIARILVIFIMDGMLPPQLFFHANGTHVHHLNYGIILLSVTGAFLIFGRPTGARMTFCAILYGIGLGLTFDEFGMWLHLGGLYWQRASFDAVITIAGVLTLIAFGSQIRHWRPKHVVTGILLLVVLIIFGFVVNMSLKWAHRTVGPKLLHLEQQGPS